MTSGTERHVYSIDPGKSTGIALGVVREGEPYRLLEAHQIEGGVTGLIAFLRSNHSQIRSALTTVQVCEKFTPLQNKGFAQTLDSTEPLRCEGALIAMGVMPDWPTPEWRRPQSMYLFGGKDLKAKKSRGRQFLKENGMYVTGSMVGCKDADDARSAIWHGVSYAAQIMKSRETFDMIAEWSKKRGA